MADILKLPVRPRRDIRSEIADAAYQCVACESQADRLAAAVTLECAVRLATGFGVDDLARFALAARRPRASAHEASRIYSGEDQ